MKYEIKMEYILIILMLIILSAVMFYGRELTESGNIALMCITSAFGAIIGFLFGKSQPDK